MKKASRTCVVVAGMHRSGTSALARVLNLVGCDLPKNILGINETNETGHWEPEPIIHLNDELLESAGSFWDDCTPCTPGWFQSPKAEDFKERCIQTFENEYGTSKLSVLKEPRICRLLPFWLDVLESQNIDPLIILPVRNPLAVADSLAKRDLSDHLYNQHLWLRHVLDAEKGSRGKRRFFCGYDELVDNWSTVISKSEDVLGFKWPRLSPKAREEVDQYIASRHRHHTYSTANVLEDSSLSSWLRETYTILLSWIAKGEAKADFARLDAISSEFDAACTAFARVLYRGKQAHTDNRVLRDGLGQIDQSLAAATQQAAAAENELNGVRQNLAELAHDRDTQSHRAHELENALTTAHSHLSAATLEVSAKSEEISGLEARVHVLQSERDSLSSDLQRQAQELVQLRDQQTGADETISRLTQNAEQLKEQIAAREQAIEAETLRVAEEVAQLTKLVEETKAALESRDARLDEMLHMAVAQEASLAHTQHQRDELSLYIQALQQELQAAQSLHHAVAAELADATSRVAQRESVFAHEASILQSEADNLRNALATLQQERDADAHVISELKAQIDGLVQDVDGAKAHGMDQATQARQEASENLDKLQSQLNDVQTSLTSARDERDANANIIEGLKAHIDGLIQDVDAAKAHGVDQVTLARQEASENLDKLQSQLDDVQTSLTAAQNERDANANVIEGLKAHIDGLIQDVDAAKAHGVDQVTLARQEASENLDKLQSQFDDVQTSLTSARDGRDANANIIEGLKSHIEGLIQDVDAAKAHGVEQITQARQEASENLDKLQSQLDDVQTSLTAAQDERDANANVIEGLKAHIGLLIQDVDAAKAEGIEQLETAKADAEYAQSEATRVQSALQTEADTLRASLSLVEQERDNNDLISKGLKSHIDLLMHDIAEAEAARSAVSTELESVQSSFEQERSNAQTQQASLQTRIEELEAQIIAAHAAKHDQEQARAHLEQAAEQTARELVEYKGQALDAQHELTRYKAIAEGLKQHVHLLMGDVDTQKTENETEKKNQDGLWRIIDQMQADLSDAQSRESQAQGELSASHGKILAAERELEQLKQARTTLQDAFNQTQSALRQRQAETNDLTQELSSARQALERFKADMAHQTNILANDLASKTRSLDQLTKVYQASQANQTKIAGQLNALVGAVIKEKPARFQRKSAAIKRKAAIIQEAQLIDPNLYLARNEDVAKAGMGAVEHFVMAGFEEGRTGIL